MKIVLLDGNRINSIKDLHDTFKSALDFPEYYGGNLDALHDMLTEITDEVGVIIVNVQKLADDLGERWFGFIQMLADLEDGNIKVCFDPFDELEYEEEDEEE